MYKRQNQELAKGIAFIKSRRAELNVVQMVENMRDQAMPNGCLLYTSAIAALVKGKTLVVIAHKLPAIMNADQICGMDHGKMVATGKHQELIQACPEYQKLWKAAQDLSLIHI